MASDKEMKDNLKTEQMFFSQRLNLFFIAESMLIIAFVTTINISLDYNFKFLLAILGFITTIIFFYPFIDNANELRKLAKKVKEQMGYYSFSTTSNFFFGIAFPIIFLIVWILIMLFVVLS